MDDHKLPRPKRHPVIRQGLRWLFWLFYGLRGRGQTNVPAAGPVILAANHGSYYDPLFVALPLNRPTTFMAWAALFTNPLFGWLIREFGAFPVNLERDDVGAFRSALRLLHRGDMMVIFPEAGRSPDGSLMPLREGVAHMALRSGAPIVPVRIHGSFESWPKGRRWPRIYRRVCVEYGEPIVPPAGLDKSSREAAAREIMARLAAFIGPN